MDWASSLQAQPDTWRAPTGSRYGAVLELPLGEGAQDFLAMYRTIHVATSVDGHSWALTFAGSTAALAIRGILDNPKDIWLDVPLRLSATARFVRLQLDASHKSYPWFIPDLQVIGPQ